MLRLTRDQVRRIDALAVERYQMTGLVLMENAGRGAAEIIDRTYGPAARALIACGAGNNGGDGYVIARHLHNRGWTVRTMLNGAPDKLTPDAAANFHIVNAMSLTCMILTTPEDHRGAIESLTGDVVVIDALLGTGFSGQVRPPTDYLIRLLNAARKRAVVAVDLPSGLDCDTGEPSNATIRADRTITFVAEKTGFASPRAREYLGSVEVVDIGVPRELIEAVARGEV